jgi:hypothetical protein
VLLGTYQRWSAYAALVDGQRLCFARSVPVASSPKGTRDAFLAVTTKPAQKIKDEFSTTLGYTVKSSSAVVVDVDRANFEAWAQNNGAWIRNVADGSRLIAAMRGGNELKVEGTAASGAKVSSRYSLRGFAEAVDRLNQECE